MMSTTKFLISFALIIFLAVAASADTGKIEGKVTVEAKGDPIPFASVQIDGSNRGTMTDTTGSFILKKVPCGPHVLIVSAMGYETRRIEVTVPHNDLLALSPELTETVIEVGGLVVTGTRTPRYVKDVPIFTEVVSKASIEDKAAHNIFEALDGEAGVRVEEQCQGCNFSVLRMQGLGADHTQVLLDGQPVYSGLAAVYGLQQLSTADIDQIEIVKGAGSALYGSNAVAGAINIVTSIPRSTDGKVSMELGEHGTQMYSFSASTRKEDLGLFLFAQQVKQDELDETGDVNAPGGVDEPDGWIDRVRADSRNAGFNLFVDNFLASDQLVLRGRVTSEKRLGGWLTDNQFEKQCAPGTERMITDRLSGQAEYQLWFPSGSEVNLPLTTS
jgi:outer membrane receptor for ferrienterochelin and colicins